MNRDLVQERPHVLDLSEYLWLWRWVSGQSPVWNGNWYRCSWSFWSHMMMDRDDVAETCRRQESSSRLSFCIWTQPSRLCKREKKKSVQAGISHLFKVLITRCLTSAPISIHEPLIFVTKSSRLDHLRGEDANKGERSHGASAALSSVSRSTPSFARTFSDDSASHTYSHVHVCALFIAKHWRQLRRCWVSVASRCTRVFVLLLWSVHGLNIEMGRIFWYSQRWFPNVTSASGDWVMRHPLTRCVPPCGRKGGKCYGRMLQSQDGRRVSVWEEEEASQRWVWGFKFLALFCFVFKKHPIVSPRISSPAKLALNTKRRGPNIPARVISAGLFCVKCVERLTRSFNVSVEGSCCCGKTTDVTDKEPLWSPLLLGLLSSFTT